MSESRHLNVDQPMRRTLILAVASTAMATLFYFLGGELAEVSNESGTLLGFSFRAGGALAGFFLIFFASRSTLLKLEEAKPVNVRLSVTGEGRAFRETDEYAATCRITRVATGDEIRLQIRPRWAGINALVLDPIPGIYPDDRVAATIRDAENRTWQVREFVLREPLNQARALVERRAHRVSGLEGVVEPTERPSPRSRKRTATSPARVGTPSGSTVSSPDRRTISRRG